jgi:hypothetical protein
MKIISISLIKKSEVKMKMNNKKNPDLLLLLVVFRQAIKLLIYLQRTQEELLA